MSVKIWDKTNGEALPLVTAKESDDIYSTTEVKTNKVWIDGKPIYRKVVSGVTSAKDEWGNTFNVSDLHIDNLIKIYGFIKRTDGVIINVPCDGFMAHLNYPTVGYIGTKQMYSWENFPIYLTIEYTKAD